MFQDLEDTTKSLEDTANNLKKEDKKSTPLWVILVPSIIGGVAVIAVIVALTVFLVKKNNKKRSALSAKNGETEASHQDNVITYDSNI